jgi:hypothetical protein
MAKMMSERRRMRRLWASPGSRPRSKQASILPPLRCRRPVTGRPAPGNQPAGLLPQRIYNSYSKAYNKRYGHSGTLFQGNYRVIPVNVEGYLLHLCRYIHANPVLHGLVDDVADWPYSNYLEWIGEREGTLVDGDFVQAHFRQPQSYKAFITEYLAHRRLPHELAAHLRGWEA